MSVKAPELFTVRSPKCDPLPIIVSVPHAGTAFPEALKGQYRPEYLKTPEDTDWFVDRLYGFAPDNGISLISANYSRWVIDLNRDPESKQLYSDGRPETALVSTNTFSGKPLFLEAGKLNAAEIEMRKKTYYWPYYQEIEKHLKNLRRIHKNVLLFDAHSIKRHVPSIRREPFPDMILGNQDGKTCPKSLLDSAYQCLAKTHKFKVKQNDPFKGGHLTRYFGAKGDGIYALQLEMSQDMYMNEATGKIDEKKFAQISAVLAELLKALAKTLGELK